MTVRRDHLDAARALNREMLERGETEREFRVIDLASRFDFVRQNESVRQEIFDALVAVGLATTPRLTGLTSAQAELIVRRTPVRITDPDARRRLGELLRLTVWTSKGARTIPDAEIADTDPVNLRDQLTWFHFDLLRVNKRDIDRSTLFEFLAERCPGITEGVITDLFDADENSWVRRSGIGSRVRVVSIPEIVVEKDPGRITTAVQSSMQAAESHAGMLRRRMTEIAAGDSWVLTVWHEPTWHGMGLTSENPFKWAEPVGPDPQYPDIVDLVALRWVTAADAHTGHHLAMMILVLIAHDHANARRAMYGWLDSWDVAFYAADAALRTADPKDISKIEPMERTTLLDLRQLVTLFRADAVELNSPQAGYENAWFRGRDEDVEQFGHLIDRTVGELRDLSDSIRTSFDLLATAGTEQALVIARAQEERTKNLGEILTVVGFLLLGPSLVAALLALGKPSEVFNGGHFVTSVVAFIVGVVLTVVAMTAVGVLTGRKFIPWRRK